MIQNASFEFPGALPGFAESWSVVASCSQWELAGFTELSGYERGEETFSWFSLLANFDDALKEQAIFDGALHRVESFSDGWLAYSYATEFDQATWEQCSDGFQWLTFEGEFTEDNLSTSAVFATGERESFDSWQGAGVPYYFVWAALDSTEAGFDGASGAFVGEQFDGSMWSGAPFQGAYPE